MPAENVLYYGDNLDVLRRHVKDETVDLVYLDPPFNSQQDYNVLFKERAGVGSAAQIGAFEDTWHWDQGAAAAYQEIVEAGGKVSDAMRAFRTFLGENDMMAYLAMMAPRLLELRRVLKSTGSIYLHCDPTASHYLKMVMDAIFGPVNFRNEIIWKRTSGHSDAERYGSVHDILLFYVKGAEATWNPTFQPYEEAYVEQYYRYSDPDGRRFMSGDLGAAGLQGGGYVYEWKGVTREWRCPKETMGKLDRERKIFYTRNGIPRLKRYLDESKGLPMQDVWTDLEALRSWHAERLGYPTQKPKALLERIILASSKKGDLVLDPFCGCGTTVEVAEEQGRRWIGIDVTHLAVGLMKARLTAAFGGRAKYQVIGEPTDLAGAEQLAVEDKFQFECWALGLVGARHSEHKKGADRGIDGRLLFHDEGPGGATKQIILSVKGGGTSSPHVRDLVGVLDREKAQIGVLISLQEPTRDMRKEAASAGFYRSPYTERNHPRLQLLTIKELFEGKGIDYPGQASNVTLKRAPAVQSRGAENLPLFDAEPNQPSRKLSKRRGAKRPR
ncbi:MAG: restriction endonuclease [Candidatus Eisenbacteria bacterium]|nr:restriction endonuclease [Candidatus Eisenbacteria bacterium]